MGSTPEIRRGDVVEVRLDPVEGSEQGGVRPALVLSPDIINQHSPVVIIASITSRKVDRVYPFEVVVEPPQGGLTQRSKVMLMQIRSIDKRRVTGVYGGLSQETMCEIEDALQIAVGLTSI